LNSQPTTRDPSAATSAGMPSRRPDGRGCAIQATAAAVWPVVPLSANDPDMAVARARLASALRRLPLANRDLGV
jgi:hypothetical protein